MNHFIYSMISTDPAPAAGGDTKSWFDFYKWDVDGLAFVPVKEEDLNGCEIREDEDSSFGTLWFVMDQVILGCVEVHAVMPSLSGSMELHYDTRLIQAKPDSIELTTAEPTGRAGNQALYEILKRRFDAQYPPRNPELASSLGYK